MLDKQIDLNLKNIPEGVIITPLEMHSDVRGNLTEIFRASWLQEEILQWNFVRSEANVLRGIHVHRIHTDYLIFLSGHASLGLMDLRSKQNFSKTAVIEFDCESLYSIVIPPGIAHGFYFREPSTHIYGTSTYWNTEDELGCKFDDPNLSIPWSLKAPILSDRDKSLPSFEVLLEKLLS